MSTEESIYAEASKPHVAARFWGHVRVLGQDECWPWMASRTSGYGEFWVSKTLHARAHRVAWTISNGTIPNGLFVLHRCDNRPCCNPRHLFVGTSKDNVRDMVQKDRHTRGERNGQVVLTEAAVRDIVSRYVSGERSRMIAAAYGVSHSLVSRIVTGKAWAHLGVSVPLRGRKVNTRWSGAVRSLPLAP